MGNRFESYYETQGYVDEIETLEQIDEDLNTTFFNSWQRLTGTGKQKVNPKPYDMNFIIGSKGYADLLNRFGSQALQAVQGEPNKKSKMWIKKMYQGVPPSIQALNKLEVFNPGGPEGKEAKEKIKFFAPVESVKAVSIYKTNRSWTATGDILLWDVETKDSFDGIENIEELEKMGWKEGMNQFVISTNQKGAKFWMYLTGIPFVAWVRASRLGQVTDPYGFAYKDDIVTLKKLVTRKGLTKVAIDKELFNQLVPTKVESVENDEEIVESMSILDYIDMLTEAKTVKTAAQRKAEKEAQRKRDERNAKARERRAASGNKKDEPDTTSTQNNVDNSKRQPVKADQLGSSEQPNVPEKGAVAGNTEQPSTQPNADTSTTDNKDVVAGNSEQPRSDLMTQLMQNTKAGAPPEPVAPDKTAKMDKGWLYTFNNGGRLNVYTIKNPTTPDDKYKIAFDAKGKEVISKIPELAKLLQKSQASELD